MLAAVEDIDAVLAVDRDGGDIGQSPPRRQFCKIFHHAVAVFARAENGRHVCFSPPVLRHSGMVRRTRPGISRFRVRFVPRNDIHYYSTRPPIPPPAHPRPAATTLPRSP